MTVATGKSVPAWKSLLANLILLGVVLLISLAAGEAVLRAFVRLPMKRILPEVKYASHPVRRFTLVPSQTAFTYGAPVRIDGLAFRSNGAESSGHGERVDVLALGDSFTFGLGVRDDETWPAQLQQKLSEASGRRFDVVNAGTISYGVFQELDLLKSSALATRPRVLVHALYWNDFMNASAPEPGAASVVDTNGYLAWDRLSRPRGGLRQMMSSAVSSSALLYTLRQAVSKERTNVPGSSYATAYARFLEEGLTPREWAPVEDFYRELKRLAAERDFRLLVAIMPVSDVAIHKRPAQGHAYATGARDLLRRLDIPYVDAFQLLDAQSDVPKYFLPEAADAHLNPGGYRLVADALAKALLENRSASAYPGS
jgi:lysophospholipase L1-like esterase